MKHKGLLLLLVLLGLGLIAAPAPASTVSLGQGHSFSINLTGASFSSAEVGASASVYSEVLGGTVDSNSDYPLPVTGNPASVSATVPAGTWTGLTFASTSVSSPGGGINVGFDTSAISGMAPDPAGSISQSTYNDIFLTFTATATSVTATIGDVFTLAYQLSGNAGSPFFYQLNAYADLYASFYSDTNWGFDDSRQVLFSELLEPISDFTINGVPFPAFVFTLDGLEIGETVYLDLALFSSVDGLSQVPVPPSLLLFGSGLGSLLLLGRRKKNRS